MSQYAAPARRRPHALWWFVGGGLLVAAVVGFVVLLVMTASRATRTDDTAVLDASRQATLSVEADRERMLYVGEDSTVALPRPDCVLRTAAGDDVPLSRGIARTTVTTGARTWVGVGTFTSPEPSVTVSCPGLGAADVRVGEPLGAAFAGGIAATILVPLVLGLLGLTVLVVTAVLWFTRAPRPR